MESLIGQALDGDYYSDRHSMLALYASLNGQAIDASGTRCFTPSIALYALFKVHFSISPYDHL